LPPEKNRPQVPLLILIRVPLGEIQRTPE
jgi:hypothetical protein